MTGQEVIALLQLRLGNRTDLAAAALLELNLAQTKAEGMPTKFWFLEQDFTTAFATIAGVEYVSIPTGFIVGKEEGGLFYQSSTITTPDQWVEIEKDGYSTIKAYYKDDVTGAPAKFDFMGGKFYLRPIPDAVYNLRIIGYFKDTVIANDATTNQWLTNAPDLLMAMAGEVLASRHIQDEKLAAGFQNDFKLSYSRLIREHELRIHTGRMYSMGDE